MEEKKTNSNTDNTGLSIALPTEFKVKIGETVKYKGERWYIIDIVYSMAELDWLVLYYVIDDKDIIQKNGAISHNQI